MMSAFFQKSASEMDMVLLYVEVSKVNGENRYLAKLAVKNINRNRGRSFFIGLSVAMSVVMAVWILAFFDGLNHQIENAVVKGNVGHWQLQEKNYALTTDPTTPVPWDVQSLDGFDKKIIQGQSPELVLDGYISGTEENAALQVVGIDFKLHQEMFKLGDYITSGHWPTQTERGIVIGQEVAEQFQYAVGDSIVINFQDTKGELRSELLPVLGIYNHNGRSFERKYAYVSGDVVEEFLFGAPDPQFLIHRVVLITNELAQSETTVAEAAKKTNLSYSSWKQINPEMGVVLDFHEGLIRFFFVIIAITVTVTILTPVSMLWHERLSEIRMMSIIGVPKKKIWRLGMFEAVLMTFLAATTAAFFILVIVGIHTKTGIDFRDISNGQIMERAGIQLPRTVFPRLLPKQLLVTYGFVILIITTSYAFAIRGVLKKAENIA